MISNTYDKSSVYFFINNETGEKFLIGDKKDLIKYITKFVYIRNNVLQNPIFDNFNVTGKDSKMITVQDGYFVSDYGYSFPIYVKKYVNRSYSVVDGYERYVDIRIFSEEIKQFLNSNERKDSPSYFWMRQNIGKTPKSKKKHGPRTKSHTSKNYRHMTLQLQALRENSSIKDINKEFGTSLKKVKVGWNYRTIENNWKSQYKVPSQHNIHNAGKNNKSIRKDFYDDEIFDMDELLAEDF